MKPVTSKNIRDIGLHVIVLALIVCASVVMTASMTEKINTTNLKTKEYISESSFDEIMLYLNNLMGLAKISSQNTANSIRDEIIKKYPDKDNLKDALDNMETEGLLDIFQKVIEDKYFNGVENYNNDIFIANYNGILFDYDYHNIPDTDNMIRTWDEERENYYNKELFDNSIMNLLEQNIDGYIVLEKNKTNDDHVLYKTITRDTLFKTYNEEGIEGLKNYTFLVPSYIYNHEDILGTSDIVNGVKVNNYKIIVVQEFNLYDQIDKHYSYLTKSDKEEYIVSLLDDMKQQYWELCLILGVNVLLFIIKLCSLYNYIMTIIPSNESSKRRW